MPETKLSCKERLKALGAKLPDGTIVTQLSTCPYFIENPKILEEVMDQDDGENFTGYDEIKWFEENTPHIYAGWLLREANQRMGRWQPTEELHELADRCRIGVAMLEMAYKTSPHIAKQALLETAKFVHYLKEYLCWPKDERTTEFMRHLEGRLKVVPELMEKAQKEIAKMESGFEEEGEEEQF